MGESAPSSSSFTAHHLQPQIQPRRRIEDFWQLQQRYQRLSHIFNELCTIRQERLRHVHLHSWAPEAPGKVSILYKKIHSSDPLICSSESTASTQEQLVEKVKLTQISDLPNSFLQAVFHCLDHLSLKRARLVCTLWAKEVSTSPSFLERTIFVGDVRTQNAASALLQLQHPPKCRDVAWRSMELHALPWPWPPPLQLQLTSSTYASKYLATKFAKDEAWRRGQKWAFGELGCIILIDVDLNPDSLHKLLSSSPKIHTLQLQGCTFTTATSGRRRIASASAWEKMRWRLRTLTASMDFHSLAALSSIAVLWANSLSRLELEVSASGRRRGRYYSHSLEKGLEGEGEARWKLEKEFSLTLLQLLKVNRGTLIQLKISLQPFVTQGIIAAIFFELPKLRLSALESFEFGVLLENSWVVDASSPILGFDPSCADLQVANEMEAILRHSRGSLRRIDVPFWKISVQELESRASFLSDLSQLVHLGGQFVLLPQKHQHQHLPPQLLHRELPLLEMLELEDLEDLASSRSTLRLLHHHPLYSSGQDKLRVSSVVLHGFSAEAAALLKLRCSFPWLKHLEIEGDGGLDGNDFLQEVIKYFPHLEILSLQGMVELEDIGLMGEEPMSILKEYSLKRWRDKGYSPLYSMSKLKSFRCRGEELRISDVGIIYGFKKLKSLESLELSGSPIHISYTGLVYLAKYCPNLRSLTLQLSQDTITEARVEEALKQFRFLARRRAKIEIF